MELIVVAIVLAVAATGVRNAPSRSRVPHRSAPSRAAGRGRLRS
jgi:hypothetical protein